MLVWDVGSLDGVESFESSAVEEFEGCSSEMVFRLFSKEILLE